MIAIAIDGPAGVGKSTVAKMIAKKLDLYHLDSGAMYRAVAYAAQKRGIEIGENADFIAFLNDIKVEVVFEDYRQKVLVNGEDTTPYIRSAKVSVGASQVAKIPAVRVKLVGIQQEFAKTHNVIMDGRDIGTTVLPHANYKFFLTADLQVRAKRRYLQNRSASLEEIQKDIQKRDLEDENRESSPLVKADDAILIDTGNLTQQETADKILEELKQ